MTILRSELYSAFYDGDPAPITAFVRWLVTSYSVSESPHILDIGCGPGRMLTEFAQLGWHVVGMEPDPDYLAQAAQVAHPYENVRVQAGGFGNLGRVEEFDLVTAINGPFYYLRTVEERVDALRRIFRALKPTGVIFLDLTNFLWVLSHFRETSEETTTLRGRVTKLMIHHAVDVHQGLFIAEETFVWPDPQQGEVQFTERHQFAIIPLPELLYFVKEQGFTQIRTYSSYDARESERLTGPRMIVSAQKPVLPQEKGK